MTDTNETGRWGRTPFRPDDLREQYGATERGRLEVTCPGCGDDHYPVASCCVKEGSRTADPFCQKCGVDFRAAPEDIKTIQKIGIEAETEEAADKLRQLAEDEPELSLFGEDTIYREDKDND